MLLRSPVKVEGWAIEAGSFGVMYAFMYICGRFFRERVAFATILKLYTNALAWPLSLQ